MASRLLKKPFGSWKAKMSLENWSLVRRRLISKEEPTWNLFRGNLWSTKNAFDEVVSKVVKYHRSPIYQIDCNYFLKKKMLNFKRHGNSKNGFEKKRNSRRFRPQTIKRQKQNFSKYFIFRSNATDHFHDSFVFFFHETFEILLSKLKELTGPALEQQYPRNFCIALQS